MRGSGVVAFDRRGSRIAAAVTGALLLTLDASPALGDSGGGSQQMSFEMLLAAGSMIEGMDYPVTGVFALAVNNRGQYALKAYSDRPGNVPFQYAVVSDRGVVMGAHLANIPVEHNGQTAFAELRSGLGSVDINNRGRIVAEALPTNEFPQTFEKRGLYIVGRNGVIEHVVSLEEPLPWWTGGSASYQSFGSTLKISDDDRVLIEGNATPAGGSGVTHISRFDRAPGGSDFIHTNVAAHGMPVAGGVYVGGGFASAMGSNGRIVLSSVASLPAPDGFGYKLFDEGVPILQQGQPAPVPGYFITNINLAGTNSEGSATVGMGLSLTPGGVTVAGMVFNTTRGVINASASLGLDVPASAENGTGSGWHVDQRGNTYAIQDRITPDGEFIRAIWKNTEPLLTLGMDIGDGRTITDFGSQLDVSDNGRWLVATARLSDGSVGPLRVYVPAPGAAAMLALSAPVLVRRRRASRDSAKHL